jgi:hypothetical protein
MMIVLTRFLAWVDSWTERGLGAAVRWLVAVLARLLRRGRHRSWRSPHGSH